MSLNWLDTSTLDFKVLKLLEYVHILWFPREWQNNELGIALKYNPEVAEFMKLKSEGATGWMDELVSQASDSHPAEIRRCEIAVMQQICDWLVYVLCPEVYDRQPFLKWDNRELLEISDFTGKIVVDIGSGTGRLIEPVVEAAKLIFAVEPVERLRRFIASKFTTNSSKVFPINGLITNIPLPAKFCDIVLAGHVFGDNPEDELLEIQRIVKPGGMVILCPGNNDKDNPAHFLLLENGYSWSKFEEPTDGIKRKYWKYL
ncbi:MAG: class I SAM-dependent methyltransferase [Calditrichaeota bacterium]|nr:class I SAM-dependent methyltransferase [Calditrichota bacterium]